MDLNKFKLLKQDDDHYHVGHENGTAFKVEKKNLSSKGHAMVQKLAEGTPDAPISAGEPSEPMSPQLMDLMGNPGAMQSAYPEPDLASLGLMAKQPEIPQSSVEMGQPAPAAVAPVVSDTEKALKAEQQSYQDLSNAAKAQTKASAESADAAIANVQKLETANDIYAKHEQQDAAYEQALRTQKIDPNRVYHNMSTGNKIGAAIAVALGSVGAGLAAAGGTPTGNLALKAIDDAISKDIDAQKNDQSNTMNLWKMNRDKYGNEVAANAATQNQLLIPLKLQLEKASTQFQGAQAQVVAQQGLAKVTQEIETNRKKLAALGDNSGDPAMKVAFLVPEVHQEAVYKEIERAQDVKKQASNILEAFDKAAKEQSVFSKNVLPRVNSPGIGMLHQALLPSFKDIEGTVRQAAMDATFENVTPAVGDSADKIASKRRSLEQYVESKSSAPRAKNFGIDLSKAPSTNSAPKYSPGQVVSVKGAQYQVGPDGNQLIPVK